MLATGILLAGGAALTACSDKYDLDERTPDGWGSSIYGWLDDQGNFTNTVRLIEDLGYKEVLAKTGSKTLFAADDAAYERFYQNNPWGVKSYADLSDPQKKMLLFGNMIGNSIQINSLSTIQGTPLQEGEAMRRFSDLSEFDTVPILKPADMPDNKYWKRHRESGKDMVCLQDGSAVPMLLFLESQMSNKRITNEDYSFLFNNTVTRQAGDASINGIKVIDQNVRCANGFIHRTEDVVTPLPNMAELIAKKSQVSTFNRILERFCAPFPDDKNLTKTERYNYLYQANVDTVYTKHFFNDKRGVEIKTVPGGRREVATLLPFDPEWNSYYSSQVKSAAEGNAAEQRDMAVMMVPTNEAMEEYWNGAGKPLRENFASWDEVDDETIIQLLKVNMLPSFVSSVPSKFDGVLNDANDKMGLDVSDVDSVWLACNGAVYLTNKVFAPTRYISVLFPPLINKNMKILNWAINQCKYDVYLNALGARYSFFVPTNEAMLEYIDPTSYGKEKLQLLSFRWNDNASSANERIWAVVYDYDPVTGARDSVTEVRNSADWVNGRIQNSLRDILDTHIVIGEVWKGEHTYFRSKNGCGIRVTNPTDHANMTVEGSYQINEGSPLKIARIYDQRPEVSGGNGIVYVLDNQPLLGTRKSVRDQLAAHPEFEKFLDLLDHSGLLETVRYLVPNTKDANMIKCSPSPSLSVFNTYHYTIYVPSNESIQQLQTSGQLPTWEAVAQKQEAGDQKGATADSTAIVNFLKYHIQDNALYLGAEKESGDYETSLINEKTHRFYMLKSKLEDEEILVQDAQDVVNGTYHKVVKKNGADGQPLYNIQAREYLYNGDDPTSATDLYTSSSAVIHLIDKPLNYGN
jgi:uncharacterized surface protein with fasciclin (FAS1) repeats